MIRRFFPMMALIGLLPLAAGCTHVHAHDERVVIEEERGEGPPPWAPAHGYRRKQDADCDHGPACHCNDCADRGHDKKGGPPRGRGKGPKK